MTDKLQGRSSLIINYFMYTLISSVPLSNTHIHLTDWPQQKSGIHFPKHMRCRPKIYFRMHFLHPVLCPVRDENMGSFNRRLCPYQFCAPLTLSATRSASSPQSQTSITIYLSNALHSYRKIFDPKKGRQNISTKFPHPPVKLHGVTSQNTSLWMHNAVRTLKFKQSNFTWITTYA
jgi:hypothetical protein